MTREDGRQGDFVPEILKSVGECSSALLGLWQKGFIEQVYMRLNVGLSKHGGDSQDVSQ